MRSNRTSDDSWLTWLLLGVAGGLFWMLLLEVASRYF
jgi:hypothetical protein